MPECRNCGAFVTKRFVRVSEPEGADGARVCPECPDLKRDGAGTREKKT